MILLDVLSDSLYNTLCHFWAHSSAVEQSAHNRSVLGSNPSGPTNRKNVKWGNPTFFVSICEIFYGKQDFGFLVHNIHIFRIKGQEKLNAAITASHGGT